MKVARVFIRSGRELTKRSFAQMGEVGKAIEGFVERGETAYGYWNEIQNFYGICVELTKDDLLRVRFDSGRQNYYRIYK